jgi:hypothetical protein
VTKATGRNWDQWFSLLDRVGMSNRDHKTIVAAVKAAGEKSGWWQQEITVQYERARGLRDIHQRSAGHYEISRLRTFTISDEELISFVTDGRKRGSWINVKLPKPERKVLSGNPLFTFPWPGGKTTLMIVIEKKGPKKASITVVHRDLAGPAECEEKKAYWTERLAVLKQRIETR